MKQNKNKLQGHRSFKKYYWDDDTLSHFRFEASYISKDEIKKNIDTFVEVDCVVGEGETYEELSKDLFYQVYNIVAPNLEGLTYEMVLCLKYGDIMNFEDGSYIYHYFEDDHIVYKEEDEEIFCILLDHKTKSLTFESL
jgi:hypothetical protein